jgi:hypothetical protein
LLLLIVTIGTLNVCLGFGLAMYYGYGPPGLDGIFQSLGPMPPATPDAPLAASRLGELYVPTPDAAESRGQPAENDRENGSVIVPPAAIGAAADGPLDEEAVLDDVRQLTAAAQTAMAAGAAQASE